MFQEKQILLSVQQQQRQMQIQNFETILPKVQVMTVNINYRSYHSYEKIVKLYPNNYNSKIVTSLSQIIKIFGNSTSKSKIKW